MKCKTRTGLRTNTTFKFSVGSESAVNTLTDVFVGYFGKLCKLFKINVENQTGGEKNIEMIYVCRAVLFEIQFV